MDRFCGTAGAGTGRGGAEAGMNEATFGREPARFSPQALTGIAEPSGRRTRRTRRQRRRSESTPASSGSHGPASAGPLFQPEPERSSPGRRRAMQSHGLRYPPHDPFPQHPEIRGTASILRQRFQPDRQDRSYSSSSSCPFSCQPVISTDSLARTSIGPNSLYHTPTHS